MNAKIIFVGNYKGGVGKTTSVLNFAEFFSRKPNTSVLVLDLDSQSSLSEILVSKGNYGTLAKLKDQETLNYVFDLSISKIEHYPNLNIQFDDSLLIKSFSGYNFIPSSLFYQENVGLDSLVLRMKDNIQYLSILKSFVDTIRSDYDYILVDCPPTNNLITRSAFLMSDYYVVPTILDGLSTNGVLHYIHTIEATYREYCIDHEDSLLARHFFGDMPKLLGIFYNMIRGQVNYDVAKEDFETTLAQNGYDGDIILNKQINNYIDIARKTQNGEVSIQKDDFMVLADELFARIYADQV